MKRGRRAPKAAADGAEAAEAKAAGDAPAGAGGGSKAAAKAPAADEDGGSDTSTTSSGDGDGDGGDTGGSSSSDEDIDVDAATAQQLMALEHELQTNPSYEKHLEYIALLRATPRLRARLRGAHEALAAAHPLGEDLWLAWLGDELEAVGGPDDVERLLALMRRATADFLSPAVWDLYLQAAHDLDPEVHELTAAGVDRYRTLCEQALAGAGLHLGAGHGLWERYRKFELAVEAKAAAEGGKAAAKQQDRVRALYQRQLQVPLADVEATLAEYKAWEAGHGKPVPPHVAKAAEKAQEAAALRAGCEAAVAAEAPSDVAKLGAFLSYIRLEQNGGDAARVQAVYERAVAAFPATASLWLQYGQYMEAHTKLPAPIRAVYERAARCCPRVGAVWERDLRALDLTGATREQVDDLYERALAADLQNPEDVLSIALARIDYLRHAAAPAAAAERPKGPLAALRGAFAAASELMLSRFPDHLDRSLRLPAYWSHCEVHLAADVKAARAVWEDALKGGLGRFAEAWEAYIAMERAGRCIKEARALYKRAYSRRFEEDGQLRVCAAWLRFEREEGSADDYLQALLKVEPILEESAAAAAAAADQAAAAAAKAAAAKAKTLTKEEIKAMRQAHDPNFSKAKADKAEKKKGGKAAKRERDEDASGAAGDEEAPPASAKRVRIQEPEAAGAAPDNGAAAAAAPAAAAAAAPTQAAAGDGDTDMAEGAGAEHVHGEEHAGEEHDAAGPGPGAKQHRPLYTDKQTVFIKGLRGGVKDSELEELLKKHVPDGIKDIRIIRDAQGLARGFAYVECASREALDKLVQLHGITLQGVSLFIAESKPPGHGGGPGGRGPGGRFSGGRGRFGGPPPHGGRGFGGRGGRGGRGRGGGEGDGDGDADMADADGGHHHPPGVGGGRGGGGRHAGLGHPGGRGGGPRTHLQVTQGSTPPVALVPRSVQMAQGSAGGQPMSNDDFRKMLLGGKK